MATVESLLSEQFYNWERCGRGWQVWPHRVPLEPPFVPFPEHGLPPPTRIDDGRRPTLLSSLVARLSRKFLTCPSPAVPEIEERPAAPLDFPREIPTELRVTLPMNFDAPASVIEHFMHSVSLCHRPLSFELFGLPDRVTVQFTADPDDLPLFRKQFTANFPDLLLNENRPTLASAWTENSGEAAICEFALGREFMLPLANCKHDPFIAIAAALGDLTRGELGLFQVIFQPVIHPWADSIVRAVTDPEGRPFFRNSGALVRGAQDKAASTLYGTVLRVATRAADFDRAWAIARDLASSLRVLAKADGNELIPLHNHDYPFEEHEDDVLLRRTHRSGMILTTEELVGLVHIPSSEVRFPKSIREFSKTKAVPEGLQTQSGFLIGLNNHAGRTVPVRLSPDHRVRHTHIIGATGTGKSTLLFNLTRQDIEAGEGIAVLDPHGDLIDRILGVIPEERANDVIVFDPSDEDYSIAFNVLSAHSDLEKNLLASDLVSVFERLSKSWGDQMASVFQNAVLAFLESTRGGTLADLRRFLLDTRFREQFLQSVTDPDIQYYWRKAFPQLSGNRSIGPVLTRLDTFLARKPIRHMVSQPVNRINFGEIMDTHKIFLAKLSEGLLGKENAFLLGSLLVAKFQQTAMSRQAQRAAARKPFWVYVDEFQNFITPTLAEILAGARKYRVGLILAHQELRHLERDREVASAVLSNAYTRIVFRVGDDDARKLAEGFASFERRDLQNLDIGHAICRVERSDHDFTLSIPLPKEEDAESAARMRQRIISISREKYGTRREDVEAMLRRKTEPPAEEKTATSSRSTTPGTKRPEAPAESAIPPEPVVQLPLSAQPAPPVDRKAKPAPDLGRGGSQHKAIQSRIKATAEGLGFLGTIEREIPENNESVDLLLERSGEVIACEISLTTTVDHEVGNVAKCLKAGFPKVAVICLNEERLRKIAAAVSGSLGSDAAARVGYFQPDEFIIHLRTLVPPAPKRTEKTQTRRGWKINRTIPELTPEQRKLKEDEAIR